MVELRVLGELQVLRDDRPLEPFSSDKVTALLLYVALEPGPHDRGKVATLLWEGLPAGRARANLRHALHKLQQKLPELLQVDRKRIALHPESSLRVDIHHFTAALRGGAAEQEAALALYRGELAAGLSIRDAGAFVEWLIRRREAARLDYLNLLEIMAVQAMARQQWREAVRLTERQLDVEPLREAGHRRLVELHTRLEAYDEALHRYETCRRLLAEELGTGPALETAAWRRRVLQLRRRPRHNLPVPATPFVGRAAEVERLVAELGDPHGSNVMLFGPGGIGKSRLALAVGQRLRPAFLDGVVFVDLADLADSRGVVARVAGVLARDRFAGPAGATSPAEYLRQTLEGRRYLLILDNGESVAAGAAGMAEVCADLAETRLLLTTRRRLTLAGRWIPYQVSGLQHGAAQDQEADDAVRFFVAAARRTLPDFTASADNLRSIRQIATLTGGMPLALELAAAWVRLRSCRAIAAKLARDLDLMASRRRDIPPRQRSIRAVFDSLWQQLREAERHILLRLVVFRAPSTTAAAAAVAGAGDPLLEALNDAGVLSRDARRWTLHPLLRQYVEERLYDAQANEARHAHTEYYAKMCTAWQIRFNGPSRRAVLANIDAVEADLYLALAWARQQGLNQAYAQLLDVLGHFFVADGRLIAGFQWLQREHQAVDGNVESTARRLHLLGVLAQETGWLDRAREYALESLRLSEPEHSSLAARVRLTLGTIAYFQGEYDEVVTYVSQALDHFREAGLSNYEIDALIMLGLCHASLARHHGGLRGTIRGDHLARARDYFAEGRRLSVERENQVGQARCLHNLGYILYVSHLAEPDAAKLEASLSFFDRSAELLHRTGHQPRRARSLNWKGIILSHLHRYDEAETSHLQALQLASDMGAWVIVTDILHALAAWVDRELGRTERAALLLARVTTHPTTDARIRHWAETYLAEVTAKMDERRSARLRRAGASIKLQELASTLLAGELKPPFLLEDAR